ncbi:hypothetical protein PG993_013652, partial [Apiospora rasikravindrae]
CPSCDVLLRGLQAKEDGSWSLKDVSTIYGYGFRSEYSTLTLEVYFIQHRPKLLLEFFDPGHKKSLQWEAIRPRTSISGHPMSIRALAWVKSKLQTCIDEHNCCDQAKTLLPRRILALDASHRCISVRVVQHDSAVDGRYAALSHCWGQGLPCTLTKANLGDREAGVSWKELPKTFQDAIRYCLRLDVHYLWIDSLCIIQDDPGDWQSESAKMADIYQNAYITLGATAAASGSIGLFPQKSRWSKEPRLQVAQSAGHAVSIGVRRGLSHWTYPMSEKLAGENPLLARGWVFQERLLSPRVLHFCKEEMVWECRSVTSCECGSMPVLPNSKGHLTLDSGRATGRELGRHGPSNPSSTIDRRSHEWTDLPDEGDNVSDEEQEGGHGVDGEDSTSQAIEREEALDDKEELISVLNRAKRSWAHIVEQYSALSLTRDTDRLPALSGLAARMADLIGSGEYKAGLWSPSLRYHLAWRVDTLPRGLRRPQKYRGPSWSWASVDAHVQFWEEEDMTPPPRAASSRPISSPTEGGSCHRESNGEAAAEEERRRQSRVPHFISCIVKTEGLNPFGEVSSAALVASGLLQPASLRHKLEHSGSFELDVRGSGSGRRLPSLKLPFFPDYSLGDIAVAPASPPQLHLFMLFPRVCLVLVKLPYSTRTNGEIYRRIGIIRMAHEIELAYGFDWMEGAERISRFTII